MEAGLVWEDISALAFLALNGPPPFLSTWGGGLVGGVRVACIRIYKTSVCAAQASVPATYVSGPPGNSRNARWPGRPYKEVQNLQKNLFVGENNLIQDIKKSDHFKIIFKFSVFTV